MGSRMISLLVENIRTDMTTKVVSMEISLFRSQTKYMQISLAAVSDLPPGVCVCVYWTGDLCRLYSCLSPSK